MNSDSIEDNELLEKVDLGRAWIGYPPKKILLPSDDTIEVDPRDSLVSSEVMMVNAIDSPVAMGDSRGGKNIKKKNKTRKNKKKKYKTKKKKRKN